MALEKKEIDNFLPNGFETLNQEGYKEEFSDDMIQAGYEKDVPDLVSGPNLNSLIDKIGKNFNILDGIVKFFNNMPIGSLPTVNNNNQLDYVNNNFLNKTQITNCILEAPNGVATYSGANLTVKSGLKVLFSNGFNSDGTLNNVEFTFSSDETIVMSSTGYVFAFQDSSIIPGDVHFSRATGYYEQENEPEYTVSSIRLWYKPSENQFYYRWGGGSINSWTKIPACLLGYCTTNEDGSAITSLTPYQPVEIAKEQDLDGNLIWRPDSSELYIGNMSGKQRLTIDLSDIIPNDGNIYMLLLGVYVNTNSTLNGEVQIKVQIPKDSSITAGIPICGCKTQVSGQTQKNSSNVWLPVFPNDRNLYIVNSASSNTGQVSIYYFGYRKVR